MLEGDEGFTTEEEQEEAIFDTAETHGFSEDVGIISIGISDVLVITNEALGSNTTLLALDLIERDQTEERHITKELMVARPSPDGKSSTHKVGTTLSVYMHWTRPGRGGWSRWERSCVSKSPRGVGRTHSPMRK
jgi:hypothetical protein